MTSPRFLPLFMTQFLGAMNDNLFKNALVILVTYQLAAQNPAQAAIMVNVAFGLFVLPTILFSAIAGQIADKYDRAAIARWVKMVEIGLAMIGGVGFVSGNVPLLMATLFGFGAHSAFFGPVKYAILPQHLAEDELITGNGFVEAGTFLAILGGTILGGVLILAPAGQVAVPLLLVVVAVVGWYASRKIPASPAPMPDLHIDWNPVRGTCAMLGHSRHRPDEFRCVLGISWFWFFGASFLAQFSPFAHDVLRANEHVVTLFLVLFSVGIALGSMGCARLIHGRVRATPVPVAALLMSVFAIDLAHTTEIARQIAAPEGTMLGVIEFLSHAAGWRMVIDLLGLAVCGGFYIVPLYALLQIRADKAHGARAIASNNLMNALFMVMAALVAVLLLKLGVGIPGLFLLVGIANIGVALYISRLLPFSLLGAVLKIIYRVEVRGLENWDKAGDRVLVVANHTAFLDAPVFAAFLPGRVGFAVNSFIARRWWLKPFLRLVDAFPIDPSNPMAAKTLIDRLKQNQKIMIFPEGRLTQTGSLMKIYEGPGMIADKSGAMILPVRIDGAQYSPQSRLKGKVRIRLFPKITVTILPPRQFLVPEEVKGRQRRQMAGAQLYDLMAGMIFDSSPKDRTLFDSLLVAKQIHGGRHIVVEDQNRQPLHYRGFLTRIAVLQRVLGRMMPASERHIGLLMPNMTAHAVAFFAVQAMGRVAAMLNFTASPEQIAVACSTAQLRYVITARKFVSLARLEPVIARLEADGIRVIYLEDIAPLVTIMDRIVGLGRGVWSLPTGGNPQDPAVILFTSGSEGVPKGVVLSHQNILANRFQLASRIDFGPQDIVFNCLPMFHAFGLTGGTLLPLLSGIKVFFYPSPLHYRIVPELVYDSNATILFGTDTFLSGYARFANPYDFYAVRYVFAGAEKLKDETRHIWSEKFGIRIFEGYGATETAPVIAVNTAMHYRAGTVGRVMPGIETRLDPVPGITEGAQLSVRGPNVMLGYLKNDALGVLCPPPDGWYDTGDIVAIDANGFVTIKGRTKRFAKIAGEMVSLTAVETWINAAFPADIHAVVAVPDDKKGEQLVLVTTRVGLNRDDLLTAARGAGASELMIPRQIKITEAMPMLGTGKVDYVGVRAMVTLDT